MCLKPLNKIPQSNVQLSVWRGLVSSRIVGERFSLTDETVIRSGCYIRTDHSVHKETLFPYTGMEITVCL